MAKTGAMYTPTEEVCSEVDAVTSVAGARSRPEGVQGSTVLDMADEDRRAARIATAHEMEEARKLRAFLAERRWTEPGWDARGHLQGSGRHNDENRVE